MELVKHAKSASDNIKSIYLLVGCYLFIGCLIFLYAWLKVGTEQEFYEIAYVPQADLEELPVTFEEYEKIMAPPPKAKKENVLPKIVEKDSLIQTDTIIQTKADETKANPLDSTDIQENEIEEEIAEEDFLNTGKIYFMVDKMPEFPGGEIAFRRFVSRNLKYPQNQYNNGVQGIVYVRFCVTVSGKVDKIKIVQGVNQILDSEVLRVISMLPPWAPGEQKGVKVAVWITVPVIFKLNQ